MRCGIWYHLYNFKNVKNNHEGALLLVKLLASACTFNKSNTPLWVFFTFFKLYNEWYQIAQRFTYIHLSCFEPKYPAGANLVQKGKYSSICVLQAHTSLEPPLEQHQDQVHLRNQGSI